MEILFLTPAYPPFPGGGERYVRSLALALRAQGHGVTVVTSTAVAESDLWQGRPAGMTRVDDSGITVIRCGLERVPLGRRGLLAWRKSMVLLSSAPINAGAWLGQMARHVPPIADLPAVLDDLPRPDVVHGFNISWEHALLAGWRYAAARGLPFFATPFAHLGTAGADRVARNSTMRHQIKLLRSAAQVFTLTAVERRGLAAFGVPSAQMTVVGSGVDAPPDDWHTAVLPDTLPDRFALFVGRNSFEKGAIHAAEAVLRLRERGVVVQLVLVGQSTPEFARWQRSLTAIQRAGILPLGLVSEPLKHALLERCDLLLLPSRTDSLGIVLLEAWQHARPVIGANAGGIPGVIDAGQNGLLVEFGDVTGLQAAVLQLWQDAALRDRLGRAGQQKLATTYTWTAVAERTSSAYTAARR